MADKNVKRKFVVSMAVDGRVDVEVEANNVTEAFELAKEAFMEADFSKMETVDSHPVNAYDVTAETYTDAD